MRNYFTFKVKKQLNYNLPFLFYFFMTIFKSVVMKSIVFDNAGTILKRVTALKDMSNNNIIFETNTIGIVNKNYDSLILVFQTPTKKLFKYDCKIIDYLKNHKESYEISYSRKNFSKDDIIDALQNDNTSMENIKDSAFALVKKYEIEICSGSAMIIDMSKKQIDYIYTAGGLFFEDTKLLFDTLNKRNYAVYIASGDNLQSLSKIASILNVPKNNIFHTCNVKCKEKVIRNLQEKNNFVLMVGNNSNDYLAIKQADIGIISTQQGEELPLNLINSADYVIDKISDVLKIIEKEV